MLLFFDTEFTGLHKNTTLISIGIVAENGKTFYAEFNDYDKRQVDDWIKNNVIENLLFRREIELGTVIVSTIYSDAFTMVGNKYLVKICLTKWLEQFNEPLQLVSDVCHYDMILLIDIFGDVFSLPENLSPVCHDINQDIANFLGISDKEAFDISREEFCNSQIKEQKHNALYDAKIIKACYNVINVEKNKRE